jgi:NitT/TauT family transport system ATP-binding protein
MVTHNISEAVFLSDKVLILTDRPGRIHAQVPIELPKERGLETMGSEEFTRLSMQIRRHIESIDTRVALGP